MAKTPVSLPPPQFEYRLVDTVTMAIAIAGGENSTEIDHYWVLELDESTIAGAGFDASGADAGQNKVFADWKHWHSCCCGTVHDQTYPRVYLEEGPYSFLVHAYVKSERQYWHFLLLVSERDFVERC